MRNRRLMPVASCFLGLVAIVAVAGMTHADVCNIRVVTDGSPDYTDIGSMLHSITDNWPTMKDKCWAIWYWNQIGRRQTNPMILHGLELTDPIRQFNDYGFTMCSTVAGTNCSIWGAAGWNVKFWDITAHTVAEVEYDGFYHMYDSSLSALYTTCDGSRLASVTEIGAEGACAASGGKTEIGHIAKYHCLCSTSPNGFLIGADTQRPLSEETRCFTPKYLKYRYYTNNWDLGHRYIFNLRDGEAYTRYYHPTDTNSPNKVSQSDKSKYDADPAYFVPNENGGKDPETANPRYHIRSNGLRTWTPPLTADELPRVAYSAAGVRAFNPAGVVPAAAGTPGEILFKVEGANVISSMTVKAGLVRRTADDAAVVSISRNNGITWKDVYKADKTGEIPAEIKLLDDVNGAYDVLVKVSLTGKFDALNAQLTGISFETITMVNGKTQPKLKLGKNTIYVGTGEQTGSVIVWPELQNDKYKDFAVDAQGVATLDKHQGWTGVLRAAADGEEGYVTFRVDTPGDMTRLTFGGRFYNRAQKSHCGIFYSFDEGRTWQTGYMLTETTPPFDTIHYEKVDVPQGKRSALVKYTILSNAVKDTGGGASVYAVRIEANYLLPDTQFKPMEVTYAWGEVQKDYTTVSRSHRQLVDHVPFTYTIDVGGEDHPVMESLQVNLRSDFADNKRMAYGYSDGQDVGGEKFVGKWITWGKNLSVGKPYTVSVKSDTQWGAGDPEGTRLTDGVVGPPWAGGTSCASCALYKPNTNPVITLDLGAPTQCGAFCIDVGGYPWWDAIKGEFKDKVELLVSLDDKDYKSLGFYDLNLRWKDLPLNVPFNDDETFQAHNFPFIPPQPVMARYVRWALAPARLMTVSEVQVWDSIKIEPFDIKIALPDGKDRSDITKYNPKHTPSKPYKPAAAAAAGE